MDYPYDEIYLASVQNNLGFFFQIALRSLRLSAKEVQDAFLASDVPTQIEMGNPDYLCGKSGYELALIAFPDKLTDEIIKDATAEPFYPEAEYWSGMVIAFCQWKLSKPFSMILAHYPLERILSDFHLMHEADITKMAEQVEETIASFKNT